MLGSQRDWRSGRRQTAGGVSFSVQQCLDSEGFTKDPKRKLKASFSFIFAYYRHGFQTKEKEV